jgi:hypothetical protein
MFGNCPIFRRVLMKMNFGKRLFLIAVLALQALSLVKPAVASISLDLSPSDLKTLVGSSTVFNLSVKGAITGIGAYEMELEYDPLVLDFAGISFGPYLGAPSESITGINALNGCIQVYELSLLTLYPEQPTDFTLFNLFFKATGTGTSDILIDPGSLMVADINGDPLPTSL